MSLAAIMAFNSAIGQMQQNQQTSQNIDQARAKTDMMQQELDIAKQTKQSKIDLMNDQNLMSDYQAKTATDINKTIYKHADAYINSLSDAQDFAQHKADMAAQQAASVAKNLHATDPDVQNHVGSLLQGMNVANGKGQSPSSTQQAPSAAATMFPDLFASQQASANSATPLSSPAPNPTAAMAAASPTGSLPGGGTSAAGGVIPSIFPQTGATPQVPNQQTLGLFQSGGGASSPVTGTPQGMDAQIRTGAAGGGATNPVQAQQQPMNNAPQQSQPQENGQQQPQNMSDFVDNLYNKVYGTPKGMMWLNPSTGQAEANPFYMKSKEAELNARAQQSTPQAKELLGMKEEKMIDDRFDKMQKSLDPSQYRAGAFGQAKQVFDKGARLDAIISASEQYQKGGADSRQIQEIAVGFQNMLAGGTSGSVTEVENLVPKTAVGNFIKLKEWLTNEPEGLNQQKFVERLMGSINRERDLTQAQMDMTRLQRLPNFNDLKNTHSDKYQDLLDSYDITKNKIDAFNNNAGNYQSQLNALAKIATNDRQGASNQASNVSSNNTKKSNVSYADFVPGA